MCSRKVLVSLCLLYVLGVESRAAPADKTSDTDKCTGKFVCLNGGTCRKGNEKRDSCLCTSGFTGINCEKVVDPCAGIVCNHGTCVSDGGVKCQCDAGYTGDDCNTVIDPCAGVECNHGTCMSDGNGGAKCQCDAGYTGNDCNTVVDLCDGIDCHHGVCFSDGVSRHDCQCDYEYTGDDCTVPAGHGFP